MSKLYEFSVRDIDGNIVSFDKLRGKVVLIVNTASKCGHTPQYEGLERLHEQYGEKGLAVLGFPSNDFMFQEPGSNEEIKQFCQLNYGVDFPMFEKIHVKGKKAHSLFQYLSAGAGNEEFNGAIQWNFAKFLFDQEGNLVNRFDPATKPDSIEPYIQKLLLP